MLLHRVGGVDFQCAMKTGMQLQHVSFYFMAMSLTKRRLLSIFFSIKHLFSKNQKFQRNPFVEIEIVIKPAYDTVMERKRQGSDNPSEFLAGKLPAFIPLWVPER